MDEIEVGDIVVLESEWSPEMKVIEIEIEKDGDKWVTCQWFYGRQRHESLFLARELTTKSNLSQYSY